MTKNTLEEIFDMCDSRYELVNIVAEKAREVSEDAEKRNEPLLEKPVNIVLNNLKNGRSTIVSPQGSANLYHDIDFDVNIDMSLDD